MISSGRGGGGGGGGGGAAGGGAGGRWGGGGVGRVGYLVFGIGFGAHAGESGTNQDAPSQHGDGPARNCGGPCYR